MKLLLYCLFLNFQSFGQDHFPDDWMGNYSGTMQLGYLVDLDSTSHFSLNDVKVEFQFEEVIADSLWNYTMTYRSEEYGDIIKDYCIRSVHPTNKCDYVFDEKNGILMEMSFMNGVLFGMYEVSGMYFFTSLRKIGDDLFFELVATRADEPLISKTMEENEEDQSIATSYKTNVLQSVLLKKE